MFTHTGAFCQACTSLAAGSEICNARFLLRIDDDRPLHARMDGAMEAPLPLKRNGAEL